MSDPRVLLLDEPSLGLAPLLCKELFQALGRIRRTSASASCWLSRMRARAWRSPSRGYLHGERSHRR